MLDPIMDIDIRQIKDSRLVVSTEDAGDRVRDIPTESWSEVVVVADDLVHLLERDLAAVPWQDACKNVKQRGEFRVAMQRGSEGLGAEMDITVIRERVQRRAGAPTVVVGGWNVLWPAASTDGDLSGRLLRGDKVVQHKAEVCLEDEEDLDEVRELPPAGGGSTTESVGDCRGHRGGRRERE